MDSPLFLARGRGLGLWLAPALVLLAGMTAVLSGWGGLGNALSDAFQRHAARAPIQTVVPVRVLELPSLDEDSMVRTARSLAANGARAIIFTAPGTFGPSPQSLAARLPPGADGGRAALLRLSEPGHDLAQTVAETRAVVPILLGTEGRGPRVKARFVYHGTENPFGRAPAFQAASAPPLLVEINAAGSAAATLTPDGDGVVRRLPLVFRLNQGLVPGMAAEALRVANGASDITVASNEHDPLSFFSATGIGALETPSGPVPTDSAGRIRLHFAANGSERMLNADAPDAIPLRGAIVLVGGAGQTVQTPLGPASTASVLAEGIENLLSRDVLTRPGWTKIAEALALLMLAAGTIALLRLGPGAAAGLAMAGVIAMMLASWYLYIAHRIVADAATPSLFLLLAFGAGFLAWLHELRLRHDALRMAFADALPRASIEKLARRPSLLKLDGETRTVTYLVCGVRGLAGLAAAHKDDPSGFTDLMGKILNPLIDQALAHGGAIDRLTADGFTAFWNAPLDDAEHALHACEAAHAMTAAAARWSEDKQNPSLELSIGIATGSAIAGGFGTSGRMGYSVHGEPVALAQRLQGLSHHYGMALVADEDSKRLAERGFAFLEIDRVAAGNNDPPVTIYAVMGNPVTKASPKFRALTVFHDHIFQATRKQNWAMARELIAQCRRLSGASQQLYERYLARIAWYEQHPPGTDWDGAFRPILE
jgi:adenylate cyclase